MPDAATISIIALRYGPHGRMRAPALHPKPDRSRCAECGTVLVWSEPTHPKHEGLAVPHCPCCESGKWDSRTCGPVPPAEDLAALALCECGAPLQRFSGPNSGGLLCPDCDAEHFDELVELGELCP